MRTENRLVLKPSHVTSCFAKAKPMVSAVEYIETSSRPADQMRSTPPTQRKIWFDMHVDDLSDRDYWSCLATLWITDYLAHERGWWHDHLWCNRPYRSAAMTPAERAIYEQINGPTILYRGYASAANSIGISWTDDPSVAEFFAYDFLSHQPGYTPDTAGIVSCVFHPTEVALFKNENGEREFIVSEPAALVHITDQMTA